MDCIVKIGPKLWRSLYEGPPQSGRWNTDDLLIDLLGGMYRLPATCSTWRR